MVAGDGRAIERDRRAAALGVEGELDRDRLARLSLHQAADPRRQLGRQHRFGPQGQVDAGGASPRLGVDRAVGIDEEGHVGDVHPGPVGGALGAYRDGVVEVARRVGVDREGGQRGEVAAPLVGAAVAARGDRGRLVARLGGELPRRPVGHLEPLEHGRQVAGRAEHLDDQHAVSFGRHGQNDVVGMRRATAARHEVAALVAEQRLERPELAPARHASGKQRRRRDRQAAHGFGARDTPAAAGRTDPAQRLNGRRRGTAPPGPAPRRAASWDCRRRSRWARCPCG